MTVIAARSDRAPAVRGGPGRAPPPPGRCTAAGNHRPALAPGSRGRRGAGRVPGDAAGLSPLAQRRARFARITRPGPRRRRHPHARRPDLAPTRSPSAYPLREPFTAQLGWRTGGPAAETPWSRPAPLRRADSAPTGAGRRPARTAAVRPLATACHQLPTAATMTEAQAEIGIGGAYSRVRAPLPEKACGRSRRGAPGRAVNAAARAARTARGRANIPARCIPARARVTTPGSRWPAAPPPRSTSGSLPEAGTRPGT